VATTAHPLLRVHALPCLTSARAPRAITPVVRIAWPAVAAPKPQSSKAAVALRGITPVVLIVCAISAESFVKGAVALWPQPRG
jgi:hypothetical protein